jgi:hypothetical protein
LANALATDAFPAVVRIGRLIGASELIVCTGTFVSPTTLLTAAHCIDETPTGGVMLLPGVTFPQGSNLDGAIAAVSARAPGAKGSAVDFANLGDLDHDVAVVTFPPGVAPGVLPIGRSAPAIGTRITMVGFGRTTLDGEPADPKDDRAKRTGTNTVIANLAGSTQIFTGGQTEAASVAANGQAAFGEHGDSGGPLLVDGHVVGVLSTGGSGSRNGGDTFYYSTFTDLNSATGKQFLDAAEAAGVDLGDEAVAASPPPSCP